MSEANMNNRFDFCANGKVVYKGTQFTEYEDVEDTEQVVNPYGDLWGTVSGAVAQIVNMHPFMQTLVHNIQYMGVELMNSILMAIPIALTLNDPAAMAGRGTVVLTGSRAIGAGALLAIGASKVQIIDPNIVFAERGGGGGGGTKNTTTKEGSSKAEFSSPQKLDRHYEKHVKEQGEFGNITKEEYLVKANNFIESKGSDVLTKIASNGDVLKWNKTTNEFSIVTKDGVIRTYYKLNPKYHKEINNLEYWNGAKCNY